MKLRDFQERSTEAAKTKQVVTFLERLENSESIINQLSHSIILQHLGEVSASISHEFINPITIIKGNLLLLKDRINTSEKNKKEIGPLLDSIERATERMENLAKSVLKASHSESVKDSGASLSETIKIIQTIFAATLKEKRITLNFQEKSGPVTLILSEGELLQIFLNLITNSIDAIQATNIPGTGEIHIHQVIKSDGSILLNFKDNGCGIKPANRRRIFEPFFSTKPKNQGTGLGLSIIKKIVEKYQGTIELDSEVSSGTSFQITFPKTARKIEQT